MDNSETMYEQREERMRDQSDAFIKLLRKRGILGDKSIKDDSLRQAQQKKKRTTYHNTQLLLKNYRTIGWVLECFPDTVAEELERPFENVDELLEYMDIDLSLGNRKMESRLAGVQRSRILLDRVNEALSVLKKKPEDGERLYDLIYLTYITPEKLRLQEILYRLNLSIRQYYRLREQAITILSIRLWAAPAREVDCWLEILSLIEEIN